MFLAILKLRITTISQEQFIEKIARAKEICPHINDVPYFAVALQQNCAIWSGDKALKQQGIVPVYNTKELLEILTTPSGKKKP